ncbi:hypothetical protein [Amycolatopsis jejuensis]|uniref:hypothetical protein n=1 Tax=Amycolatopsis jejuensis TaxID=330084 RepID=UPI0005264C6F|nr:hypothetical protein [Amycolatopsis jejuensis]
MPDSLVRAEFRLSDALDRLGDTAEVMRDFLTEDYPRFTGRTARIDGARAVFVRNQDDPDLCAADTAITSVR